MMRLGSCRPYAHHLGCHHPNAPLSSPPLSGVTTALNHISLDVTGSRTTAALALLVVALHGGSFFELER